jgi:phage terminase Nu1 subunit (DNA packaging protein)
MQQATLISPAEYARRQNLNRSTISRQIKAGKIPLRNGLVDVQAANRAREQNLDVRKQRGGRANAARARQTGTSRGEPDTKAAGVRPPRMAPDPPVRGSLAAAVLMHTQARAARSALEAQKLEARLVDRRATEAAWADVGARVRDAVLGLPVRVCNRVPAEWRRELAAVLQDEARKVLTVLSDEIKSSPRAS